jgi:hypothetical protein
MVWIVELTKPNSQHTSFLLSSLDLFYHINFILHT